MSAIAPIAMTLPSASAAMRSQTVRRLSRSCVTMKTVSPSVCCSVRISSSKSPAAIGSSPDVGSSRKTSSGSSASARASATRLVIPPESSEGNLSRVTSRQADHRELGQGHSSQQPLRDIEVLAHRKLHVLQRRQRREQRALLEQHAPATLERTARRRRRPYRDPRPAPRSMPCCLATDR